MTTYLYGKNSIRERLQTNPETILKLFVKDTFKDFNILNLAQQVKIVYQQMSPKDLEKLKPNAHTQGIVAQIKPFAYTSLNNILSKSPLPTLLFLDKLNDPHNLGAIMRVVACMGGFAICVSKHQSCEVTDAVVHVASGGENYVPLIQVSNLINTFKAIKKEGYWVAGTVVKGGTVLGKDSLPKPLAVVFGSEGEGLGPAIQKHLDMKITILMQGAPLSLNVGMATAMVCYEVNRHATS